MKSWSTLRNCRTSDQSEGASIAVFLAPQAVARRFTFIEVHRPGFPPSHFGLLGIPPRSGPNPDAEADA